MSKLWKKFKTISSWRKISVGMWRRPSDPTIYGYETLAVDDLLAYLDEVSEASGQKVTLTAYMAKAAADILAETPELNTIIVGNRVMQREHINAFCQVAVANAAGGSADLSGVTIRDCDRTPLPAVAAKLYRRATKVRKGQDQELEQTKSMIDKIPPLLLPKLLRLFDTLTYAVPLDLGKFGIRDDPFGSFMITNVAPFDIRLGFAPLVPASRTPFVILIGIVEDHLFVDDGEPVVKKGCQMSFTADHRCFDGLQIGSLVRGIRGRVERPRDYYPPAEHYQTGANHRGRPAKDTTTTPPPEASSPLPLRS